MFWRTLILALSLFTATLALAAEIKPGKPSQADKCPVCGMFVAKYPDWTAQVALKDGSQVFFDGVKDMMKYYFELPKYAQGKNASDIAAVFVTDYYSLQPIDGFNAFYVNSSDVYGPMGRELIPFAQETAAKEFKRDHGGKAIIKFPDITMDLIKSLD